MRNVRIDPAATFRTELGMHVFLTKLAQWLQIRSGPS